MVLRAVYVGSKPYELWRSSRTIRLLDEYLGSPGATQLIDGMSSQVFEDHDMAFVEVLNKRKPSAICHVV